MLRLVYGLDKPLMRLVAHLKSAAYGYGTERRVLLLHGPVGSAKSTIVRLLKKGRLANDGNRRCREMPKIFSMTQRVAGVIAASSFSGVSLNPVSEPHSTKRGVPPASWTISG